VFLWKREKGEHESRGEEKGRGGRAPFGSVKKNTCKTRGNGENQWDFFPHMREEREIREKSYYLPRKKRK